MTALIFSVSITVLLILGSALFVYTLFKKLQVKQNTDYKGELKGFPKKVVNKMLSYQEEQTGKRDINVFERQVDSDACRGGFTWLYTKEGLDLWTKIIREKQFHLLK